MMTASNLLGDTLPSGRKINDNSKKLKDDLEISCKWAQKGGVVLPHYLSVEKIQDKIKKHAAYEPYKSEIHPGGTCITVQCSTGCYYAVCAPLVREWLGMVGLAASRLDDQSPLLQVKSVDEQLDQRGFVQSYLVKLLVEGEDVTLHFYNTTHSVNLQGKKMLSIFWKNVFLPFMESDSNRQALRINAINEQMTQGRRGEKRTMNPASNKTKYTPKSKKTQVEAELEEAEWDDDMEEVIPQGDQQLGDSILLLSTLHPPALLGSSRNINNSNLELVGSHPTCPCYDCRFKLGPAFAGLGSPLH